MKGQAMIEASCHCGTVRLEVPTAPETVRSCNCSICRRIGGLWAYYDPKTVCVAGDTDRYVWGDKALKLHRCRTCGCTTHWSPVDPSYPRMGVNARLMPPEIVNAARVERFDGADTWTVLGEG
jgi:hypothetical protein